MGLFEKFKRNRKSQRAEAMARHPAGKGRESIDLNKVWLTETDAGYYTWYAESAEDARFQHEVQVTESDLPILRVFRLGES